MWVTASCRSVVRTIAIGSQKVPASSARVFFLYKGRYSTSLHTEFVQFRFLITAISRIQSRANFYLHNYRNNITLTADFSWFRITGDFKTNKKRRTIQWHRPWIESGSIKMQTDMQMTLPICLILESSQNRPILTKRKKSHMSERQLCGRQNALSGRWWHCK